MYKVVDLGTFGRTTSYASDISDSGAITGSVYNRDNVKHGFYIIYGTNRSIDVLDGISTNGCAINLKGWVAGYVGYGNTLAPTCAILVKDGVVTKLLPLKGDESSEGDGINDDGVVVDTSGSYPLEVTHAVLWRNGKIARVPTPQGSVFSAAGPINNRGAIVGVFGAPVDHSRAFLTLGTIARDIGTLGGKHSFAYALNDADAVVGEADTHDGISHAFLWRKGSMVELLARHDGQSGARGINNKGQVVGDRGTSQHTRAFIWENGLVRDLNSMIAPRSGWLLESAAAINDNGQIVGDGRIGNKEHAFLLVPTNATAGI